MLSNRGEDLRFPISSSSGFSSPIQDPPFKGGSHGPDGFFIRRSFFMFKKRNLRVNFPQEPHFTCLSSFSGLAPSPPEVGTVQGFGFVKHGREIFPVPMMGQMLSGSILFRFIPLFRETLRTFRLRRRPGTVAARISGPLRGCLLLGAPLHRSIPPIVAARSLF